MKLVGPLSKAEYEAGLAGAGFTGVSVAFTHQVGDGLHSAIIKATKPADTSHLAASAQARAGAALPLASEPGCC